MPTNSEALPPRGVNPTLPDDVDPGTAADRREDLYRLARHTYRAERRYYLRLDRHRPMTSTRL